MLSPSPISLLCLLPLSLIVVLLVLSSTTPCDAAKLAMGHNPQGSSHNHPRWSSHSQLLERRRWLRQVSDNIEFLDLQSDTSKVESAGNDQDGNLDLEHSDVAGASSSSPESSHPDDKDSSLAHPDFISSSSNNPVDEGGSRASEDVYAVRELPSQPEVLVQVAAIVESPTSEFLEEPEDKQGDFVDYSDNSGQQMAPLSRPKPSSMISSPTRQPYMWEDLSQIPYYISPDIKMSRQQYILTALQTLEKVSCLGFVAVDPGHPESPQNYLNFKVPENAEDAGNCEANIYSGSGSADLQMGDSCFPKHEARNESVGSVLHELFHVFGFNHEHQRMDRDNYIIFYRHNVNVTELSQRQIDENFERYSDNWWIYDTEYDYNSIMHYEWDIFTSDLGAVMLPFQNVLIGPRYDSGRFGLTSSDVLRLNRRFSCPDPEEKAELAPKSPCESCTFDPDKHGGCFNKQQQLKALCAHKADSCVNVYGNTMEECCAPQKSEYVAYLQECSVTCGKRCWRRPNIDIDGARPIMRAFIRPRPN